MPRVCTVCAHKNREAIDQALVSGQSYRSIAQQHEVSPDAVLRHKNAHLPAGLAKAQEAAEVSQADALLAQVEQLQAKAMQLLEAAEQDADWRAALVGVREARSCLELKAKLEGQLREGTTINILIQPEWQQIRATLLAALQPHPQARLDVATALEGMSNGTGE